jgi:hypothetical protein
MHKADLTTICEPRHLKTLWASMDCYRDSLTLPFTHWTKYLLHFYALDDSEDHSDEC